MGRVLEVVLTLRGESVPIVHTLMGSPLADYCWGVDLINERTKHIEIIEI